MIEPINLPAESGWKLHLDVQLFSSTLLDIGKDDIVEFHGPVLVNG